MGQYEVVTGSYPSGGTTRHCIAAYVTFERQPDATEYDVHAFNFYDPFYYGGAFGATVYEGSHLPTYTPPCDGNSPAVLGNEVYLFLSGGHGPDPGDAGWLNGRFAGMIVEVTVTY